MRRYPRPYARVIAYAVPVERRRANIGWLAAAAGLLTMIAVYSVSAILF